MSVKKERKVISLDDKLKILQRKRDGEKAINIALSMGLAPTTVRSICNRDNERIHEVAVNISASLSKNITRARQPLIEQMESLLISWIQDMNHRNLPLSQGIITKKAKSLFENLKQVAEHSTGSRLEVTFEASRGWFHRFKARAEITAAGDLNINDAKIEKPAGNQCIINVDKISPSSKQKISNALKLIEKALEILKQNDPDVNRSFLVLRNVKEATKCYQYIFQERKKYLKQTKINTYFLPTKAPSINDDSQKYGLGASQFGTDCDDQGMGVFEFVTSQRFNK